MMLSIAKGYDAKYLTDSVTSGREGYYTSATVEAGEPPGLWYGAGAELLGLCGEVDAEQMEAIYAHLLDPRDPASCSRSTWGDAATLGKPHRQYRDAEQVYADLLKENPGAGPERRAELRMQAAKTARQAVSFEDVTFSVQKSVTVLGVACERKANQARTTGDLEAAAAWSAYHQAVEDAAMTGARAALDYLQKHAGYSRVGDHASKAGQWIDAHQFVVAQFLQHDSRNRDPQLHIHNAILNRVLCADREWRSLDSKALGLHKPAAAAIGERVTEAYLTRAVGVRFATRPDGVIREVTGVPEDIIEWFSSRRREITPKIAELIEIYRQRTGREPSALVRNHIAQQATLATRKAKSHHGESDEVRLDRWDAEAGRFLEGGLAAVADLVVEVGQQPGPPATWSEEDVILRALDAAGADRQTFTEADLIRHISDALPGHLNIDLERIEALLTGLAAKAMARTCALRDKERTDDAPADLVLANGESVFERPGSTLHATAGQLAAEQRLRQAAVRRGALAFATEQADEILDRFAASGCELGADQAAAVRGVMASGAWIEVLSAAAGTGKSFAVGALADAWAEAGHRAVGLATSENATQNLAEDGLRALNITRWLGAQKRLSNAAPGDEVGEDEQWRLGQGDLVIVDEAGMSDTASLLAIQQHCDQAGAKLLLTGDQHQLAAVGPGGTLADLSEHGIRYELSEVRRFAAEWERHASLRLRAGDATVVDEYDKRGRLRDCGTYDQAEDQLTQAWLADTLAGKDTLALVPTNETAARLSSRMRAQLVQLGFVEEQGVPLGRDGTTAGVGDLIQARRNRWDLLGFAGNTSAPINRRCYRVHATREDGGLVVIEQATGDAAGRTLTLPGQYVAQHVTLGYASTGHAAQGRTVDTGHALFLRGMGGSAAYPATTRGRESNTIYCVTGTALDSTRPEETSEVERLTARGLFAEIVERDDDAVQADLAATAYAELAAEEARSVQTAVERLAQRVTLIGAARLSDTLDQLTVDGVLRPEQRQRLAADQSLNAVQRLLRSVELAGHDPEALLRDAISQRSLDDARSIGQVLHSRLTKHIERLDMTPVVSFAEMVPANAPDDSRAYLQRLAEQADQRRHELGTRVAGQAPQWALEALGPVPRDVMGREEWEHAAGWAAAYRELASHTDDVEPLGAAPPVGHAEQYTAWRAAHRALHLSEPGADEDQMTEGRLRTRARAYEREVEWAPKWVGDELAATNEALDKARVAAELSNAQAATAEDEQTRAQLLTQARAARAEIGQLEERVAALELADTARAEWFTNTAPTREAAARAKAQLALRGVALDNPDEQVTAEEWLAEHEAEQIAEDRVREVRDEAELHDPERDLAHAEVAPDEIGPETAVADIRDTSQRHATEDADPEIRRRVPTADETAEAVARAQVALAEIRARQDADAAREAEDARRDQLTRWAEQDRTTAQEALQDDAPILE